MKFFLEAVKCLPTRVPKGVPRPGGEIFRVDVKADGGIVSIGGWETYRGAKASEARWFSIRLDRKNARWIYVKGEPYKIIPTLELLAITSALIIFVAKAKWRSLSGRLALTAFTDNQTNAFILDRFMTTAFPASAILMEPASQFQDYDLDLDLQRVPREQKVEADDLTNENINSFSFANRISVDLENLDFKILPKLMDLAGSIDEEIALKRASKATAAYQDPAKKLRVTQPW